MFNIANMKLLLGFILVGFVAAATVHDSNNQNNNHNNQYTHTADKQFLAKQEAVLQLFSGIYHPQRYHKLVQVATQFDPEAYLSKFNNQQSVKKFFKNFYSQNFLPRYQVFSPSSQQHQNQVAQLFYFFYNAQDFNTFQQAAAWAKYNFNPGLYAYAFAAAVVNRQDTRGIILPPFYEVFPEQYVPAPALRQIYNAHYDGYYQAYAYANYTGQNKNNYFYNGYYTNGNGNNQYPNSYSRYNNPHNANSYYANDDGSYYNNAGTPENPENRISYFTEDIGINAFQTGFYTQYPAFFGSNYFYNYKNKNVDQNNEYNYQDEQKGQAFYYANQQFYARYILERLSNDLPIPHPINFYSYVKPGYNPNLNYANGQSFPARAPNTFFQQQENNNNNNNNNAQQPYNYQAQNPQVYEHRIQKVADSGYAYFADGSRYPLNSQYGIAVLANIISSPGSSPNPGYYGDFFSTAKNAIGNIADPNYQNGVAPGAAANYATAARDPAYYQFLANILQIFNNYQNKLGPYTQSQLSFPGVKVENFDVDKLVTFFDNYNVNVNNAFGGFYYNNTQGQFDNEYKKYNNYNYYVKFQRLNHVPYNYRLTVNSEHSTNAVVRVFIGPKYDANGQGFTLPQASQYYFQLDQFKVQLNQGTNQFQRNSRQSPIFVGDVPSFYNLQQNVQQAQQGSQPFYYSEGESYHCGFPARAQLPRGKRGGQEYIFYAIVSPYEYQDAEFNNNRNNNNNNNNNYQNGRYFDSFYCGGYNQNPNQDGRPFGFPFDRPVQEAYFNTANQFFKPVTIFHKNQYQLA